MDLSGVSILICDDSILARRKLKDFLKSQGALQIYEAADGEDAVNKYEETNPGIVFMDIVMPNKDGVWAVEEIMKKDESAKIIMASSVGTQNNLKKALKAGASDFIQKPLEEELVVQAIEKALGGN